ncbi:MAG: hypothetical protein H0V35_10115 [Nitrospira sp.]|nr:hypothetical protein [Nitrospira sp.]
MTQRGNLLRGIVAILVMVGVVACATVASPPQDLVAKYDHAGLEAWYVKEAAGLRWNAEEMRQMRDMYAKPSYQLSSKESKRELIAHCQLFIEYYTKAAEEAERMSQAHRTPHADARASSGDFLLGGYVASAHLGKRQRLRGKSTTRQPIVGDMSFFSM